MVRPETHCPHTIRSAFSGRQGPRALSASACLTVTKAREDDLRSPTTTSTNFSPPQLRSQQYRHHVQSHPRPLHAANSYVGHAADTHGGHATYAHDGHAPEPPALHEADNGPAQPRPRMPRRLPSSGNLMLTILQKEEHGGKPITASTLCHRT